MLVGRNGGGREGVNVGQDRVFDEVDETDETSKEGAEPEDTSQHAILLLEGLIDAMRSGGLAKEAFDPRPTRRREMSPVLSSHSSLMSVTIALDRRRA